MSLAAVIGFGAVGAAVAATGPTFAVSYHAAEECPNQATFEAAILARAPRATKAEAGAEAQVLFEADLSSAPRLRVSTRDGTSQDREIVAEGCTEAMQSMAVIAAMILDAQPAPPAPVAPEPPPPPSPARDEPAPPAPAAPRRRLGWGVSIAGVAESAAAPTTAFGATAGAELHSAARGLVSPSARLGLVFAQAARVETEAGDARFRLVLGRAHLCGLRFGAGRGRLRLCTLLEGGALLGQGIDARNERGQTMPWLGAGIAGLGSFELAEGVALELGAGGRALLVRDQFVFSPQRLVHQVPDLAWNLSLGLSYGRF